MSELFSIYEYNYNLLVKKLSKIIENLPSLNIEKSETSIKEGEVSLKEAEGIIKQMELEILANQYLKSNNSINIKLRTFKSEFDQIRKKFLKTVENNKLKKDQESLLKGKNIEELDSSSSSNNQKQKLIENEGLVLKQNNNIENAKRMAIEMEHVSIGIMNGLHENNQKLTGVNAKVGSLNNELDSSNGIMTRILKKENRNKLIIAGFSLALIIAFIFIIYYKL